MTAFNALRLSRGWLSVALTSGKDKDRPALNRTVCVELFDNGVRLVATDSYAILWSWVPVAEHEDDNEPAWDQAPECELIAQDGDGRASSLMQYLYGLATAKDAPDYEMTLNKTRVVEGDGQGMFDGMASHGVVLEFPGVEKVTLGVVDSAYPNWRKTLVGFKAQHTDAVALHSDRLALLSKLGKLHNDRPILWRFGGRDRMAFVEVGDSDPRVAGAVMPMRWDFDRAMPADDIPQDDEQ